MARTQLLWAVGALAVAGLAVSSYLTWYSLVTPVGVCPVTGYFGCSAVLTSVYSRPAGIPMALLGVVWFLITGLLSAVVEKDEKWLKYLLAWSAVGLLAVFVLVYVEIFLIGSICPLCTSAHVLEITILGLTVSLWVTRRA